MDPEQAFKHCNHCQSKTSWVWAILSGFWPLLLAVLSIHLDWSGKHQSFFVVLACQLPVLDEFDQNYQASVHCPEQCHRLTSATSKFPLKIFGEHWDSNPGQISYPLCNAAPHLKHQSFFCRETNPRQLSLDITMLAAVLCRHRTCFYSLLQASFCFLRPSWRPSRPTTCWRTPRRPERSSLEDLRN